MARERAELRRARRLALVRRLGLATASSVVAVVLVVGVFPTRTWLDQRDATAEATDRLAVLEAQNEALRERIERLHTSEEIERIAREQYNLVLPGEEAYAVLPPPLPPLDLPPLFPYGDILSSSPGDASAG
ncbi:MAG: septum formation initiator family protein [Acidimicrobiia bacterium]